MKADDLLEIKQLIADSFQHQRYYIDEAFKSQNAYIKSEFKVVHKEIARLDKKIDDMAAGAAESLEEVHKSNEVRFAEHHLRIARLEAAAAP